MMKSHLFVTKAHESVEMKSKESLHVYTCWSPETCLNTFNNKVSRYIPDNRSCKWL